MNLSPEAIYKLKAASAAFAASNTFLFLQQSHDSVVSASPIFDLENTMRFHISSHHTPNNCAVHRGDGTPPISDWRAWCKEVGVEFVAGGGCNPMHNSFMFVEADDIEKIQALMQPVIGYWDVVITPVRAM